MHGVIMYHKIKFLRKKHSLRNTAKILKISVNTVQKYSEMSLIEAVECFQGIKRKSQFSIAIDFIEERIKLFPKITATKLYRQVTQKYPEITAKVRAFRNFIRPIKEKYKNNKIRHYHPVIETKDGSQVQVDLGEMHVEKDNSGKTMKIYFVVFVFSYSRMMFVHFQNRPYKTKDFIKAHLEAFQFFGGVAKEYVYDQTKLVVIKEKYREVWFNKEFHQFANKYEFLPIVCEGYDPESKGKVERGVQYVKIDFLYGEYFSDINDLKRSSINWLNEVANNRIHATTKRKPINMFEEEKPYLKTNFFSKNKENYRIVDKVGLISYKGNKYSVPFKFQRKEVLIQENSNYLYIRENGTGKEIATHKISLQKGKQVINSNHYRDIRKNIDELKAETLSIMKEINNAESLILKIAEDNPKIMRDQLYGLQKICKKFPISYWNKIISNLLHFPKLRVSMIEEIFKDFEKKNTVENILKSSDHQLSEKTNSSTLSRDLDYYMEGVKYVR